MTPTRAKMTAVLCGLSMAGAGLLAGGFGASPVAAAAIQAPTALASETATAGQNQRTTAATAQPAIAIEKALEIARGQAEGDVRTLELEMDDGVLTYKVELGNTEITIDAVDGSILEIETRKTSTSYPAATITVEKAIEIAKGQTQGDFREAELDREGGVLVWDVEIGNSEIRIDAEDGTVLKIRERTTHDEDDD